VVAAGVLMAFLAAVAPASPSPVHRRCTKMGCADQLTIRLRSSDGRPRAGMVIELELDGTIVSCVVPDRGDGDLRPCDDGTVTVTHQEIQHCRVAGCRGTGKFEESVEIVATPRRVRVRVKEGERQVGEMSFVARYARVRPNGPGCSPLCRQARRTWQYR
jgi:hypothetical protein